MAFTDRYIRVPMRLYNCQQAELLDKTEGECDQIMIKARINPFKIESYRPAIPQELTFSEEGMMAVRVEVESGETHLVFCTMEEFEVLLNKHAQKNG